MDHPLARIGDRPAAIGLYRSVALVLYLIRKNPTQEEAAAVFDAER